MADVVNVFYYLLYLLFALAALAVYLPFFLM